MAWDPRIGARSLAVADEAPPAPPALASRSAARIATDPGATLAGAAGATARLLEPTSIALSLVPPKASVSGASVRSASVAQGRSDAPARPANPFARDPAGDLRSPRLHGKLMRRGAAGEHAFFRAAIEPFMQRLS